MIQTTETVDLPEDQPLYPTGSHQRGLKSSWSGARDVVAALIACMGAMTMGFTLGYSSPALRNADLVRMLETEDSKSWFGSLVTLGAMVGGPISAFCVGFSGRKSTLMLSNLPMVIGWFLIIYAKGSVLLYCGRILTGLGIGAISLAAPLYVAEVSTVERRGTLGSGFQLLVAFGVFVSYGLGALLTWSWLAVAGAAMACLHVLLLVLVPETPRWLLSKQDSQKALSSLRWLRAGANVDSEFNEMEQYLASSVADGSNVLSLKDLTSPGVYKPLLVSASLMVFQQFSGVNAVIFYTGDIFAKAGFGMSPAIPTVIVGAVLVVFTVVSCALADLAGRRILLVVSGVFMALSIIVLGVDFYLTEVSHVGSLGWLSLLCLIVYIAFFSIGWGPVPWLLMSEIFPARAKGVAGGIATCINWLAAFVTTKEFSAVSMAIQTYGAFWLFGGICVISVIFVFVFVLETKGKSLEEIEEHYRDRN